MTIEPYSITEWRWITEDEKFKKLRQSCPLAAYLYRILWDYCAANRTEVVSVWSSSRQLEAQLQTWSMFPMRQVRAALPHIWRSGLAVFTEGKLYVKGSKIKHCTPRYPRWHEEAPPDIFDIFCQKSADAKNENLTFSVRRLTESGLQPEPEPELEPIRTPLPPYNEFPTLSETNPSGGEVSVELHGNSGFGSGEEDPDELDQYIRDLHDTFTDQYGADRHVMRKALLRRMFTFRSRKMETAVLAAGEEKLMPAVYYAITRSKTSREGALHDYAVRHPLPESAKDIPIEVKRIIYGVANANTK